MIIFLSNGSQLRGDLILSARLRSDAVPVPATLEVTVKTGEEDLEKQLKQGQKLKLANEDEFSIIKSERIIDNVAQGIRERRAVRVTALLDKVAQIAFIRKNAIIKEGTSLTEVYRAAGASISGIENDISIKRFSCFIGDTPSFHIAKAIHEAGGLVRWKNKKLQFFRLSDLKNQKAVKQLADITPIDVEAGYLERFEVPSYYSIDENAAFVSGDTSKERRVNFAPHQDSGHLFNMTKCLIQKQQVKIMFDQRICAGDLIELTESKKYTVITAAHVYELGEGDTGSELKTYTKLWLGEVE